MSPIPENVGTVPGPAAGLTVGQLLPWAVMFLNYTDAVVGDLPEDDDALDWRPVNAAGDWFLSIREQAMHIADERLGILAWITGEDTEQDNFTTEFGGVEKPWQFKKPGKAEIVARLAAGRAAVDAWLAQPQEVLLETSDALVKKHEAMLSQLKEAGQDTAEREARGPGRVLNTILFLIAHEQSHRAVLQGMLRQRGHTVTRYA